VRRKHRWESAEDGFVEEGKYEETKNTSNDVETTSDSVMDGVMV
jgi:hypothetical protein